MNVERDIMINKVTPDSYIVTVAERDKLQSLSFRLSRSDCEVFIKNIRDALARDVQRNDLSVTAGGAGGST